MAEHLDFDPAKIPCPDFSSNAYAFVRNALIADGNLHDITNHEQAAQKLRDQWEADNATLRAQYQAQLAEEQRIREARRLEEEEAERAKEAERQAREAELSKEAEKKRSPLYSFQRGVGVTSIPSQIHPYAKKLMSARKYVPLWYFLPEATAEGKERSKEAIDANRFQIAMDDSEQASSSLTLVGSHAVRASKNALPDSRLTWAQIMRGKSAFLDSLSLGDYPVQFVAMFAGFYTNMDMHPELREPDGDRVMAHYHAEIRLAWYDAMERKAPFDLSVISENILETS